MMIDKGNNVLDNYVALKCKLRQKAFFYSEEYYLAEKEQGLTTAAQLHAKEELAQFDTVMLEYKKDLK
jgi:hypothetical protein